MFTDTVLLTTLEKKTTLFRSEIRTRRNRYVFIATALQENVLELDTK